jgi:hypothetical protein
MDSNAMVTSAIGPVEVPEPLGLRARKRSTVAGLPDAQLPLVLLQKSNSSSMETMYDVLFKCSRAKGLSFAHAQKGW